MLTTVSRESERHQQLIAVLVVVLVLDGGAAVAEQQLQQLRQVDEERKSVRMQGNRSHRRCSSQLSHHTMTTRRSRRCKK